MIPIISLKPDGKYPVAVTVKNYMICGHNNSKEIHKFESISLYKCNECGIIYSSRCRENFDPARLYENYYKNETSGRFGLGIEYAVRLFRFFRAFKIFTVFPSAKKILDIGSGRGFTLFYLKKYYKYKRTVGTQISKNAFEFSRDKLGLEVYDKDLLELPIDKTSFDVITIWHVLEHVTKPENYVERIYELLDGGGKLIIEVPNYNSWTRILTGRYWLSFDLKHHLYFFTPESLSQLLIKYGFKIEGIHAFSLEYSTFTSAQSIVSAVTGSDSVFFRAMQTGRFNYIIAIHAFLIILIAPLCFLINMFLYFSKHGEMLFILAEKEQ